MPTLPESNLLDPEHHRRAVDAVEGFDLGERGLEGAELAGVDSQYTVSFGSLAASTKVPTLIN
jgi:hypothetical protein